MDFQQAVQAETERLLNQYSLTRNKRHVLDYFIDFYKRQTIPVSSGRLRAALTTPGSPDQRLTVTDRGADFGVTLPYARVVWHRLQTPRPLDLLHYLQRKAGGGAQR